MKENLDLVMSYYETLPEKVKKRELFWEDR